MPMSRDGSSTERRDLTQNPTTTTFHKAMIQAPGPSCRLDRAPGGRSSPARAGACRCDSRGARVAHPLGQTGAMERTQETGPGSSLETAPPAIDEAGAAADPVTICKVGQIHAADGIADGDLNQPRSALARSGLSPNPARPPPPAAPSRRRAPG